jgi:hypothetical protein
VRAASFAFLFALAMVRAAAAATADDATSAAPASVQTDSFPHKDVPPLVKEVFAREVTFCHDPHYPLTRDEVKWCALVPKDDPRCPDLARACSRGATAELLGQRARRQDSSTTVSFPSAPLPVRAILWVLLAGIVAGVLWAIAKQTLGQSAPATSETVEIATAAPEDPAAAIARQVETDVMRLLERARAAAAAGNYADAVGDAYAALLRKLEGTGLINVESHRTNGDHVRDVGRQLPALRPRMQAVVNNVEEVQFGGGDATESRFHSVMMDVVGLLNEKLAVLLPLVVKLAVGVGFAGLLASCNLDRDRDRWDRSTSGRVLVIDLLKRYGFTPRERLAPLAKLDKTDASVVLLPGATVDEAGWQAMARWIGEGGTLFIAGGDRKLPDWIGATIVAEPPSTTAAPAEPIRVASDQASRFPRIKAMVPGDRQVQVASTSGKLLPYSEAGDEGDAPPVPLLFRGRHLYAVERAYQNGGRVVVLADDHLIANVSLLVEDNALLLVELLRYGGPKVDIGGELTGLVSKSPVTSVRRSHLAPALLQLLLLLVLFFIYKGAHFGRPIDPIATSRRAFAEHARAIGLQYGRRRAGRHALELYGGYALERMRERLNLSSGKGMIAVAEEVATRTGRPLGDVMRVLVESRPPNQPPADPERDAAIQAATSAKDLATLRDIATLLERGTLGGSHTPRDELRQAQPAVAHAITPTGGAGERIGAQRKT